MFKEIQGDRYQQMFRNIAPFYSFFSFDSLQIYKYNFNTGANNFTFF
jgi:hypothetical protein